MLQSVPCSVCHDGAMVPTSVPRFGGCLHALGALLSISAMCAVALALWMGWRLTAGMAAAPHTGRRESVVRDLESIPGMTRAAVDDVRSTGAISDPHAAELPAETITMATARLQADELETSGAGAAIGMGLSSGIVASAVGGSLPVLVIGLVLATRRQVWRCERCGAITERA